MCRLPVCCICHSSNISSCCFRFSADFRPVRQNEGLHEFYRASSQQDIDHFIRYVGPAMSYPPAFNARPQMHDGLQQRQEAQPMNPAELRQQNGNAQQPARPQLHGPNAAQAQRWSNVVPFPAKFRQKQTLVSGTPGSVPACFVDSDSSDPRPVLLFDLNGTLTSHRAAKRGSGRSLMRPGIHHLRRLQVRLRRPWHSICHNHLAGLTAFA